MPSTIIPETIRHAVVLEPLKTVSESNRRDHWTVKHRRAKEQRSTVYLLLRHLLGVRCPVTLPCTITLTRVSPGVLDTGDNLPSALKHVRDGISDYLAGEYLAGEDRQEGLTWAYTQRQGKVRQYAVEITLEGAPHG